MKYNEIVVVSKLPGLYQIHKQRTDGLIIKSLTDDKVFFAASRAHSFTPLENITIYTNDEPVELLQILLSMKNFKGSIPSGKASNDDLKKFFGEILPEYDRERVYVSDIQKIVKWFGILNEKNLIQKVEVQPSSEVIASPKEESVPEVAEVPEKKAKATRKKVKKED